MAPILERIHTWLSNDLRRPAVFISLLLSLWIILTGGLINSDGVLYLDTAKQIESGNWKAAIELYSWLLYPFMIAAMKIITGLSLETSALTINTILFAIIPYLFLTILRNLGADNKVQLAGLILLSISPAMNDFRGFVFRDPGFWVCLLWATCILTKNNQNLISAFFLGIALSIATLFRAEGIIYYLLLPLFLLFTQNKSLKDKALHYLATYIPLATGLALTLFLRFIIEIEFEPQGDPQPQGNNRFTTWPMTWLEQFYKSIVEVLPQKAEILSTQILKPESSHYGLIGIYVTLIAILFITLFKHVSLLVLILLLFLYATTYEKKTMTYITPISVIIAINISYLLIFVVSAQFLVTRFAMPTVFMTYLLASFALSRLFESKIKITNTSRIIKKVCALLILIMAVDGLISTGESKKYIKHGGQWIAANFKNPEYMLTNMTAVYHYAGLRYNIHERNNLLAFQRQLKNKRLSPEKLEHVSIMAIFDKNLDQQYIESISQLHGFKLVKKFSSPKKNKNLLIFAR